jgi:hypothetical protein
LNKQTLNINIINAPITLVIDDLPEVGGYFSRYLDRAQSNTPHSSYEPEEVGLMSPFVASTVMSFNKFTFILSFQV